MRRELRTTATSSATRRANGSAATSWSTSTAKAKASGRSTATRVRGEVKEFIINECSGQTELINKCDEFLDDENNYLDINNSLIKNYIEENYDIKNINDLYFTGYQMLGFDETKVSYSLELSATSEEDSYSGNVIIDLKEVDNEIVIDSIGGGE